MNDMNNNNNIGRSIGFLDLLQITFIVLKFCNVIDWSWFWVLSPMIISIALMIIFFIILFIINRYF